MSNVPIGSDNDPLAPWNEDAKLCKYCDIEELKEIFQEQVLKERPFEIFIDDSVEYLLINYDNLCRNCAKEYYADDDDY